MDGSKLVELLGHASVHPELDDFLSQNGVKARPKGGDTPNLVGEKKLGLSFEYRAKEDFEQSVGTPRSTGKFVLREVDFCTSKLKGYTTFAGKLPFGVSFATSEVGWKAFSARRASRWPVTTRMARRTSTASTERSSLSSSRSVVHPSNGCVSVCRQTRIGAWVIAPDNSQLVSCPVNTLDKFRMD